MILDKTILKNNMRPVLLLLLFIILSCDDDKKVYIADSSGNLNLVNIITTNQLWESQLGETIRESMASDAEGLPQREPLYKIRHIPTKAFTGFAKKNRTFIQLSIANENKLEIAKDSFAKPQTGIFIKGKSTKDLIETFKNNENKIFNTINHTEINEKWRRMKKSLGDDSDIQSNLGVSVKYPSAYRLADEDSKNFIWLRKDIDKGSIEIFIYDVPISAIENENSVVTNIVRVRDSIGKAHIPGPREDTFMITEEAYMPYLYETKIDGRFAYESRGTWVVKDVFMGGPFLNFAIKDKKNNRFVIIEGIVYKPTAEKRNNVFEIESIGRSLKFLEN